MWQFQPFIPYKNHLKELLLKNEGVLPLPQPKINFITIYQILTVKPLTLFCQQHSTKSINHPNLWNHSKIGEIPVKKNRSNHSQIGEIPTKKIGEIPNQTPPNIENPPSTQIIEPVTNAEASLNNQTIAPISSSGWPNLLKGVFRITFPPLSV
jgi:hypothetical protein